MEFQGRPKPDVLLARLVQYLEASLPLRDEFSKDELLAAQAGEHSTVEFCRRLAERVGMQSHDMFLIAGLDIPEDALYFDEEASRQLPQLVKSALVLSTSGRQRMRDCARSLAGVPQTSSSKKKRFIERCPGNFGALFVQMLALRNMGWTSAAKVMYLMSGVYLSAATIGAIGRGVKELDPELLEGFAAVFGLPVGVLFSLTGIQQNTESRRRKDGVIETAALLWDVRHLTADQVRKVSILSD